jgi:hypothetical protein
VTDEFFFMLPYVRTLVLLYQWYTCTMVVRTHVRTYVPWYVHTYITL